MREHYSTQFSSETFDEMECKIKIRAECLQKTLESVSAFTKSCEDIDRKLTKVADDLEQVGDLCILQPGINPQIMKLNHIEDSLSKILSMIDRSAPMFTVDVHDTQSYDRTKSELISKHKVILDKLEYQMTKSKDNEARYQSYKDTHNKLCNDRDRLYTRINDFSSTLSNTGLNDQNSVVKVKIMYFSPLIVLIGYLGHRKPTGKLQTGKSAVCSAKLKLE